jgi:tRNA(Ile2) C34 agmatinyltransferase TiaS
MLFCEDCGTVLSSKGECVNCQKREPVTSKEFEQLSEVKA